MSIAIKAAKFQGDPGLFGFLGRAAKKVGGSLIRSVVPSPIREIGRQALNVLRPTVSQAQSGFQVPGRVQSFVPQAGAQRIQQRIGPARPGVGTPVTRTPGLRGFAQRLIPGGATGFEVAGAAPGMLPPRGFHLNKTGYFLQTGEFVEPFSRFVRNRRRNPGNMRAADRAISRIESAKRMAKRLGRITVRSRKC